MFRADSPLPRTSTRTGVVALHNGLSVYTHPERVDMEA
jgi:hypothetical protein